VTVLYCRLSNIRNIYVFDNCQSNNKNTTYNSNYAIKTNKWKTKNSPLSKQFENLIEKIVEREIIDILSAQIHGRLFQGLVQVKSGGVKLVLSTQTSILSKIKRSFKCFQSIAKKKLVKKFIFNELNLSCPLRKNVKYAPCLICYLYFVVYVSDLKSN
jgi:hypothetical protein